MDGSGDRNENILPLICETECIVNSPRQIQEISIEDQIQVTGDYQQYSLDIILESLIWRKTTSVRNFVFKFKHPRAATFLAIKADIENRLNRNILLESLHCKLIYVSTPEHISNLLGTWKPILFIEDEYGNKICNDHEFSTEKLKNEKESSYIASQFDKQNVLMDLKIWMCVQNIGFVDASRVNYQLTPHILDEFLALKELNELTQWMGKAKEIFLEELKVKEKEQLNNLATNWTERKNKLEVKLIDNVNRCKCLSRELQKNTNDLNVQKALQDKQQALTADMIHEETRKSVIKYSLNENHELYEKISSIERENNHLKDLLGEQNECIHSMKKTALSNQQTATLLQEVRCLEEKYMEAQKVKNYFKEQYARAVKEIHQLKTEGQKNMQTQIQTKKDELSQLSLDKFFDVANSRNYGLTGDDLETIIGGDTSSDRDDLQSIAGPIEYTINT